MKITELLESMGINDYVTGNFKDLSKFKFKGVYIVCDESDEVVYIGSAYARDIEVRLSQYIIKGDSGNTLGKSIAKKLSNSPKYDEAAEEKMTEAVDMIKKFKIYAVEHKDLEYCLIDKAKPLYNNYGKSED